MRFCRVIRALQSSRSVRCEFNQIPGLVRGAGRRLVRRARHPAFEELRQLFEAMDDAGRWKVVGYATVEASEHPAIKPAAQVIKFPCRTRR